jgi:hypothetical protein
VNRWLALAYVGGLSALYLFLSAFAGWDLDHSERSVFLWWRPGLGAFISACGVIAPAIYLGSRKPQECLDCGKAARKYARLETERNELRTALLALEPPK